LGPQGAALNGKYTIFGQCDDAAVELVKQIARMSRDPSNDKPFRPVKINHITIVKAGATAPKPAVPAAKKPAAAAPKAPSSSN
jgi:peptidyl-prolyl cis-trans isomerase A (cyclophilin A)